MFHQITSHIVAISIHEFLEEIQAVLQSEKSKENQEQRHGEDLKCHGCCIADYHEPCASVCCVLLRNLEISGPQAVVTTRAMVVGLVGLYA